MARKFKYSEFEYIPGLGPAIPSLGWVPAPRYSLRRARILDLIRSGDGRLLDIGCGPGALLYDLEDLGWQTEGIEISDTARNTFDKLHKNRGTYIHSHEDDSWSNRYDVIIALDVLEHIEDDGEALEHWSKWLNDDGLGVFSVPAHPALWNERDVQSGHFRRYTKQGFEELFQKSGFQIEHIEYYGFPLATMIELLRFNPLTAFLKKILGKGPSGKKGRIDNNDMEQKTMASGTDRAELVRFWPILISKPYLYIIRFCSWLQKLPLLQVLGNGLIIVVRKKE